MVDIAVSRNRLSVLKRYGGNVVEFCKETRFHLFGSTSVSFEFQDGFSPRKTHTADCCFISGPYWYTQVSSPVMMSKTRGDLPPSNFLACGCTSPPFPASALHLGYGAPNGLNVSSHQVSREECESDFPMKSS